MTTENQKELQAILRTLGKKRHGNVWKVRIAEDMGCDRSTVTLWDNGQRSIGKYAAEKLRRMAKRSGIKKSDIDAELLVDKANNPL